MSTIKHHDISPTEIAVTTLLKEQLISKINYLKIPVEAAEELDFIALCDIINNHDFEQNELTKRTAKAWENASVTLAQKLIRNNIKSSVTDIPPVHVFERMPVGKHQELDLYDEVEHELLNKALQYHIPVHYRGGKPDFSRLEDDIKQMKNLKERAEKLNLAWDYTCYDPIGLEQEIEEAENRAYREEKSLYRDYLSSRL